MFSVKDHFLAVVIISLSTIGCSYGKSLAIDRHNYGEEINYESDDVNYEDDYKKVTPEKIGDLEFDVEVAERIPSYGQRAPEVLVVDDRKNGFGKDFELITEVPVDVMGISQIGDILVDLEVAHQNNRQKTNVPKAGPKNEKIPKVIKNFQNLPQDGPVINMTASDVTVSDVTVSNLTVSDVTVSDMTTSDVTVSDGKSKSGTTDEIPDTNTSSIVVSDSTFGDSKSTDAKRGPDPDIPPISTEKDESVTSSGEPSTPTVGTSSIWPIILVAVVFNIFVVVGTVWAICRLCAIKKEDEEEEKKIAAKPIASRSEGAEQTDFQPQPRQPPPQKTSPESAQTPRSEMLVKSSSEEDLPDVLSSESLPKKSSEPSDA